MNLAEAGAALRAEREKRNLTVEDVAQQLKIGPRQIRALENGDIDSLPHQAYAKGFIRSYAAWLGLTPEELRGTEQDGTASETELVMNGSETKSSGGHGALWILALLGILAAVFYYAWTQNFWGYFEKDSTVSVPISEKLPTAEEYLAKKEEAVKPVSDTREKEAVPPAPVVASPVELPEAIVKPAMPQQTTQQDNVPVNGAPAPAAEEVAVAETAPASQGNHKLIITAIEECWVHSNSDKTDTRQFSLRKGDTFALTFAESLELKLGNAGGVRLRYDGQDMPAPGTSGQVKTITFPPVEQ